MNKSPTPNLSDEAQTTAEKISGNYRQFQYRFVEFIADHLADCSRTFAGDLQQMLVLAIIGQVELHALARAANGEARGAASITASRIADVTGIPRETVRRKLVALEQRGWVARQPEGAWRLVIDDNGAPARNDLAELDARSIARFAQLLASVRPLL